MIPRALLGSRLGRKRYVGVCTKRQHVAVLTSGKGTYCARHRLARSLGMYRKWRAAHQSRRSSWWLALRTRPWHERTYGEWWPR